ncbi:extracellular solute-binding protein [Paenibacillus sp. IB182496]|uniref:Extracellular solute-binding protein n=1 Tax=Paenibacillus sabuli TaxID=2772509 RepID=A0A927BY40_9BACL|nr:extracellular solute-binding protein [Paenibacillus sabuli]MBD2847448.1 extracellular solute-binding protein [Paenibacillus sabuli]
MKNGKRPALAGILALTGLLALGACSGNTENQPSSGAGSSETSTAGSEAQTGQGRVSDEPLTFKWLAYDRREAPIKEDWPVFEAIRDQTNVTVEFELAPGGLAEKRQIMIATNSVTDFIPVPHSDARTYGPDGVFLNLADYMDEYAPNLKQFFAEYPEAEALVTGEDGGIYAVPTLEGVGFNYAWIVRADLMDEYGLDNPTSPDEFYTLLKTLKQHHPDTYPLVPERGNHNGPATLFTPILRAFSGLEGYIPMDPESDEYVFAGDHPGFREALEFMHKLHEEELLDPEFAILKPAQWEERMLSGKGLVTWFWKTRVASFNSAADEAALIPGFQMSAMPQFAAEGVTDYQYSRDYIGVNGIAISGQIKEKEAAVRFLDYLVGEEGANYLAYGIEGTTYEFVDGEAKFLESLGPAPYALLRGEYGVWYPEINLNNGKSRAAERLSEEAQAIEDMYSPIVRQAPKPLVLTAEETELQIAKQSNLNTYMDQKISEFIAGRIAITDESIADFIAQCRKLGAYELRDMYNAAYERVYE